MMLARLHSNLQKQDKPLIQSALRQYILAFACLIPLAAAGQQSGDDAGRQKGGITSEKVGNSLRLSSEKQITTKVEFVQPESKSCQATLTLGFDQRNTMAAVDGTIENTMCAASGGDYELAITVKDGSGELKTLEFTEKWQRSDSKSVIFSSRYPIGDNMDLVRVRARKVHCVCTDAAAK